MRSLTDLDLPDTMRTPPKHVYLIVRRDGSVWNIETRLAAANRLARERFFRVFTYGLCETKRRKAK